MIRSVIFSLLGMAAGSLTRKSLLEMTRSEFVEEADHVIEDLEDDRASYIGLLQQYSETYTEFWTKTAALGDVAAVQESTALKDIGIMNVFTDINGDFSLLGTSKSDIMLELALAMKTAIALVYASFGSCSFDSLAGYGSGLVEFPVQGLFDSGFWCVKASPFGASIPDVNLKFAM